MNPWRVGAVIYIAYGSNMLSRRFRHPGRMPAAVARGVAAASGVRVRFHKRGVDGSGKCTLVDADDSAGAWGVLFEVTERDLETLDRVEGVHLGGYARESISVRVQDGSIVAAVTYIGQEPFIDDTLVPYDWYRELVVEGAREHGLPADYVDELKQTSSRPDPDRDRAAEMHRLLEET